MRHLDFGFYDWEGRPVSVGVWLHLWSRDRQVATTTIGDAEVSTCWDGHNYEFSTGAPLIYETAVFGDSPFRGHGQRWATLADARAGHDRWVRRLQESIWVLDAAAAALA